MAKSRKCGKAKAGKAKAGKAKGACSKDIEFGSSKKAKLFICDKMKGKSVRAVGGINGVLGKRLKKAGVGTAAKLTCKMKEMTKRNYLRYMMEQSGSNVRYAMDSYVSMKNHCGQVKDCKCGRASSRTRRC
ncbi:hypothetical protein NP493_1889g00012 [Ridgeia piscesae]|uniref:Uncharacterized protein n=1 Tax=Ridgeia piscesae TaxID=27915 RepID=A0AAD9JQE1_RIDPI|nr:hypothetical protein NP493_1889g00012 [Ridgeia piscesae]